MVVNKGHKCCYIHSFCSQERKSPAINNKTVGKQWRKFNCSQCGYKTRWGHDLKKHIHKHHQPPSAQHDPSPAQHETQQDIPKLVCTECDKLFKNKETLKNHVKMFHSSPPTEFSCFHCDYKSKFQNVLRRHLQKHMPESEREDKRARSCDQCGKVFHSVSGLASHVRDKHGKVFKYSCDICHKQYNIRGAYQKHVASHEKVSYLTCTFCDAKFRFKSTLFEHLQKDHQQNKIEYFKY